MKAEFVKTNKGSNRTLVDEAKWESAWVRWIYVRAWERGRRREGWRESVENGKYHGRKKTTDFNDQTFLSTSSSSSTSWRLNDERRTTEIWETFLRCNYQQETWSCKNNKVSFACACVSDRVWVFRHRCVCECVSVGRKTEKAKWVERKETLIKEG